MKYLIKINKARQPDTIQNYLNSIKQFNEFILCDKPKGVCTGDCHLMGHFIPTACHLWQVVTIIKALQNLMNELFDQY